MTAGGSHSVPRRSRYALVVFVLATVINSVAFAQRRGQPPRGPGLSPMAVAPGKTTRVTVQNASIGAEPILWTNFECQAVFASNDDRKPAFDVTLPRDARPGIGIARVHGLGGVSAPALIVIDDLPTVVESPGATTRAHAQPVHLPVAVEGSCEAVASDFFRFTGTKGQHVSVEVVAARVGSAMDPVVRILDAAGREISYCDDDPATGGEDPRFSVNLPADGDYVIELRDIHYEGGDAHRYRLRVGGSPLLGGGSGGDDTSEAEPNDDPVRDAPMLSVPFSITGRFQNSDDRDSFRFATRKGDRVTVKSFARSIGSACDVSLRLLKENGSTLATSKDDDPGEATIEHTFAADGTYCLVLRELSGHSGPHSLYRIEVTPRAPGFSLSIDVDHVEVPAGGELSLLVKTARRDYKGDISLSIETDSGVTFDTTDGVIKGDKPETTLKAKLAPELKPGQLLHFRVVGKRKDGAGSATAENSAALKQLFPRMLYPPRDLDGVIALGVTSPKPK
jgi:hypothetical protein